MRERDRIKIADVGEKKKKSVGRENTWRAFRLYAFLRSFKNSSRSSRSRPAKTHQGIREPKRERAIAGEDADASHCLTPEWMRA